MSSSIITTTTGLDSDCQLIILEYCSDENCAAAAEPSAQKIFYKNLATTITDFANSIDRLNIELPFPSVEEKRVSVDRYVFPPLFKDKKHFVTEVFQRLRHIAQNAGVPIERSDLNFVSVLEKVKRIISTNETVKRTAPMLGFLVCLLTIVGALQILNIPSNEEMIKLLPVEMRNIDPSSPILLTMALEKVCGEGYGKLCTFGYHLSVLGGVPLCAYAATRNCVIKIVTNFFNRFHR